MQKSSYGLTSASYEKYLLKSYEETYFSPKLENAGKYSYVERNHEMINASTYCVFYYSESYVPALRRQPKRSVLSPSKRNSGTKLAYNYALKRNKTIINLYKKVAEEPF